MNRIWLVTNAASGSFSEDRLRALQAQLDRLGIVVVETSAFPESALPDAARLEGADIDTLALYAGDGSVAAAIRHCAGWTGDVLVLPGGTMNLLAKRLHGARDLDEIVDAVKAGRARAEPLSGAAIGSHVALVGVIAGPVTAWAQAREDMREGAIGRLPGSVAEAVRETVAGEGVRVGGIEGTHRAVVIFPEGPQLEAAIPSPGTLGETLRLGWDLVAGAWRSSPGVARVEGRTLTLDGGGGLEVLVDGEPVEVATPLRLERVVTSQRFHACEIAP